VDHDVQKRSDRKPGDGRRGCDRTTGVGGDRRTDDPDYQLCL
jgi:hypothetical protein